MLIKNRLFEAEQNAAITKMSIYAAFYPAQVLCSNSQAKEQTILKWMHRWWASEVHYRSNTAFSKGCERGSFKKSFHKWWKH